MDVNSVVLCEYSTLTETHLEVLSNFTDETLEGKLADQKLSGLLVATDFTKSDSSRTEPVRLLDTTSGSLKMESVTS